MIRALLVVLVVLVAILAFVLDRPWLYAVSGASLVAALGWFAIQGWSAYHRRKRDAANASSGREHRLQDFGIVSIRPQEKKSTSASPVQTESTPATDADGSASRTTSLDASSTPTDDTTRSSDSTTPETAASTATRREDNGYGPKTDAGGDTGGGDTGGPSSEAPPTVSARNREDTSTRVKQEAEQETEPPVEAGAEEASAMGLTTSARAEEPVLVPLVESLRAAVNAHSVCLLVQEDVVLEYQIRAIVSQSASVQRSGTFATDDPLLTASMSRQPISVRRIEGGRDVVAGYLRYYNEPPPIDHIALAPVPLRDTHTTIFLLADATGESDLGAPHARALIEQYAETLALVLQSDAAGSVPPAVPVSEEEADDDHDSLHNDGAPSRTGTPRVRESDPVPSMDTLDEEVVEKQSADASSKRAGEDEGESGSEGDDRKPRPRSEIIAEEMERADHNNANLALVLVHLNRSESIARAGEDAVRSAEDALRDRLNRAAPEQRVERFGELTYGVFFRGGLSHVEPWAINLQDQMDAATGELEGGASIGVAMRGPRHDTPEALRADATQALHEAYKTGTCTIIE